MTWQKASDAGPDLSAYCFFESVIEGQSFITPEKQHVATWRRHSSAANEIMVTHFWDGDDEPTEYPTDRVRRVDPLGRH